MGHVPTSRCFWNPKVSWRKQSALQHYERTFTRRCLCGLCAKHSSPGSGTTKFILNFACFSRFFQYWHDPINFDEYLEKSQFIAEINNELEVKNASYAENLAKLENFVMLKFAEVSYYSYILF